MENILKENLEKYILEWKPLIFRVDIHLIWWCNFKCIMCDNWKNEVEMYFKYDELRKYILILKKEYNCNYIRFHWQEPTMYNRLEDLVLFSKNIWLRVAIKTNAWLLSNIRLIKILKSWLDDLYLSIDWPNSNIHDKIRWKIWSFDKNIDIIIKSRKIKQDLKIYINCVVLKCNYDVLEQMIFFWKKYSIDRVSFVFLNDKNRKDINKINLDKLEFLNFFKKNILEMYEKAEYYNIIIDFSPFISKFIWKTNDYILSELRNNFLDYESEILNFYNWEYWKIFYDSFWCNWPLDHCSINYNWDMFGCCVVERDSSNAVWNILKEDLSWLRNSENYKKYREKSDDKCEYFNKCASNFYTRKKLFKSIYLDEKNYSKNIPLNYYRYLKELNNESDIIINNIKINKLRKLLLYFFDNLFFYKKLLKKNNIKREEIINIKTLDFIKKLPILDKKVLKENIEEINLLTNWKQYLNWKTSWASWNRLNFRYPINFRRYIKQIVWFSLTWNYIYNNGYFSITPINCNQVIINDLEEPDYVNKVYINIESFIYKKDDFLWIKNHFDKNKELKTMHGDSKYILFIILWFKKYNLELPKIDLISLSYSYTNKSLKNFIERTFACTIIDSYWCSEVWPIFHTIAWKITIYWDNIILEECEKDFIVTDLDNNFFPFIRYKNDDLWSINNGEIIYFWKKKQQLNWKNLLDIDNYFFNNFPDILFYQFYEKTLSIIWWDYKELDLELSIRDFFWEDMKIIILKNEFFNVWECSKFRIIN